MGMILILTGFAAALAEMGLGAAIVQNQAVSKRHLDSVFWLNVAVGAALTVLFALAAPLVARAYAEPALSLLTMAVAITFLLTSFNVVQIALLEKSLDFRTRFRVETVALVVSGALATTLAIAGAGVWSLVAQTVTLTAMRTAVLWLRSSWRPGFAFDITALRDLLRFGGNLMGFNLVIYWSSNIDQLVIGRVIGSSSLGIYSLADRLMRLPLANVTSTTGAVMFPALSAIADDNERVRKVYLRATRMIALLTFPMMIGLSVLAEPAILVVYGGGWRDAIQIVQILAFAGMAQSIYNTAAWIFLSRARTDILLRLAVYTTTVRVIGVLIGVRWGIVGVAWSYTLSTYLLVWYPTWASAGRLVDLSLRRMLSNLVGPFICAALMGLLILACDKWVLADRAPWLRLCLLVPSGLAVYGLLVRGFRLQAWNDLGAVILESSGGRHRIVRWLVGEKHQAAATDGQASPPVDRP